MENKVAENVLATIGTVLWCIQLIPQIIRNFRVKDCEGLPPLMMFLWACSGVPWSSYFTAIDSSIPLIIQPQIFTFFSLVTWAQTLYYPPRHVSRKRFVLLIGSFVIIAIGVEAGLILGLRPLHRRGITWPLLIIGILASIFLVVGLIPPYFELAKRQGRVIGINFIFLSMDTGGAIFSMASIIVGNMDIMSLILYILVIVLEVGIVASHFVWWLRIGRKLPKEVKEEEAPADSGASMSSGVVIEKNSFEVNKDAKEISPSSFKPLNFLEDSISKKDLEEEHTREIQVEQAYNLFQSALKFHKSDQLQQSYKIYENLFKLNIISNHYYEEVDYIRGLQNGEVNTIDELSLLSPNVKSLRYLIFRNRGMLYLEMLKKEEFSESQFKELFYTCIDDLCIAFLYNESDEELLEIIFEIYLYLGVKKLSRYTLEYQLSSREESDDLAGLIPIDKGVQKKYDNLLSGKVKPSVKFEFLKPVKDDFDVQSNKQYQKIKTIIKCKNSWVSLIDCVNAKLKENQDENKIEDVHRPRLKQIDPYILTEEPLEIVEIEVENVEPEVEPESIVIEEPQQTEEKEENQEEVKEEKKEEEPIETKIQRSSKRLAKVEVASDLPEIALQDAHFYGLNLFLQEFKQLLQVNVMDIRSIYLHNTEAPQYVQDFIEMINDWKYESGLLSFQSKTNQGENLKLLDLLSGFDRDQEFAKKDFPPLGSIDESILEKTDYVHLKENIIKYLINSCLTSKWEENLYIKLKDWVLQFDNYIMPDLETAIGIFELLTDVSITLETQINDQISKKINRGIVNPLCQELLKVNDKLQKWSTAIEDIVYQNFDAKLLARFKWAQYNKEKASTTNWGDNSSLKYKLKELLKYDVEISYPNYKNFGDSNTESIKNQLTIISVLSIFWRILYSAPKTENNEAIDLLEDILMDSQNQDKPILSIRKFLSGSSLEMRLSLWSILLSFYRSNDLKIKLASGFEKSLEFLIAYLDGDYTNFDKPTRFTILSKILGFYSNNISNIVEIGEPIASNLVVKFLDLFFIYEIHEEASSISSLKTSLKAKSMTSYNNLKDTFIKTFVLIIINCKNNKELQQKIIDLVHRQLGSVGICNAANGIFLNSIHEVLDNSKDKIQYAQYIKCKFHYNIAIDGVLPEDHGTERTDIEEQDCQSLAKFILPICFKSNPLKNVPKHDVKQLIDEIYGKIGGPDFESDEVLSRNKASLNYFLDTRKLTPRFIKDSFYGLNELKFDELNHPIVQDGLYFMQGLLTFFSYKSRKKNMQSRAVEIETAISLLENDLIYGSNRLESWFLLGQAYGFLVEDDLIWTSDKLTIADRKTSTANLQRKSLTCYLMAINCSVEAPKENVKPIIGSLMSSFAKEMFSAVMQPMNMHAFKVQSQPRFINKANGASFLSASESAVTSKKTLFKIMKAAFELAIKSKNNEWSDFYYLSKVQKKLNESPKLVLDTMSKACELASDDIVEPYYTIISLCYKYVKNEKMTIEEALKYLNYPGVNKAVSQNTEFYKLICECLKNLDSADKKNWQHKPKYRLSKIYFDEFGDSDSSITILKNFISLNTPNKSLVSIWKPDSERPGKHFLYTFRYIYFYIELLKQNNDLNSLIIMLPKLRRSNSVMIQLTTAWEFLCTSICKIIRDIFKIGDSFDFTDKFINNLNFPKFTQNSKSFMDLFKQNGVPDELRAHICFLNSVNDMKKLNNGFGPTSLIDDTIVGIFFRIYTFYFAQDFTNAMENPSANQKKKIAKKDIFPITNDIIKNHKKEIEDKLKDEPDLFNISAKKVADAKRKEEEEMKEKEEKEKQDQKEQTNQSTYNAPIRKQELQVEPKEREVSVINSEASSQERRFILLSDPSRCEDEEPLRKKHKPATPELITGIDSD
ncbi:unnamed protein product [Candida verbasci]|uniref:Histone transcription regulator 3 homolog n=1 Tax=Candida verbasci TaxID=1227364 RepID=A0A9W4TYZ2_9ASCO|nr:unnamed protein product [Candida verbasci]